jgi:hypothetical protein
MNKNPLQLIILLGFISQLMLINTATGETLEKLVAQGKLNVSLQINSTEPQIVGQALIIAIEVSTDRWFAGGSQLQHFSLKNVVMQANNISTINGNKRINGQTWVTQTHEITLYPTKSGRYYIEPIKVDISVNTEVNGIVSGTLTTLADSFDIELPEALIGIENFIVSPQVHLNIEGDFDKEKEYAVGEAVTQTITIIANDTPAMMIPPIDSIINSHPTEKKPSTTEIPGLSIYHKPAKVFDKSNRGILTGTREESFTYIFEKAGSYVIDEQVIYWWNIESNSLEKLIIPASTWSVSGSGFNQVVQQSTFTLLNLNAIINLFLIILLFILSYLGFKNRLWIFGIYSRVTKREQRLLKNHFFKEISNKNYVAATKYLYQYQLLLNHQTSSIGCELMNKLNHLAFNVSIEEITPLSFSMIEAKALINEMSLASTKNNSIAYFTPDKRIELNKK